MHARNSVFGGTSPWKRVRAPPWNEPMHPPRARNVALLLDDKICDSTCELQLKLLSCGMNSSLSLSPYRSMARYNAWMNDKVYTAAGTLSDDQRKADRGAFFGSIHGTLNHILLADLIWLQRFAAASRAASRRNAGTNVRCNNPDPFCPRRHRLRVLSPKSLLWPLHIRLRCWPRPG